jgi:hypothetical protein
MNESNRPLADVTVRLDSARFADGAQGKHAADVWQDNRRQAQPISVENGMFKISLSPKGIVALAVKGLKAVPAFQDKILPQAAPAGVTRHQRITSPIGGDVEAMVLSFGPELTWLYAYQTGEPGPVKSLALTVKTKAKTQTLRDDRFPFEFSLPLSVTDSKVELSLKAEDANGRNLIVSKPEDKGDNSSNQANEP